MNASDLVVPAWLKRSALVEYFHRVDTHELMRWAEVAPDDVVDRIHDAMTVELLKVACCLPPDQQATAEKGEGV